MLLLTISPLLSTGLVVKDDLLVQFNSYNLKSFFSYYYSMMIAQGRVFVFASVFSYIPFIFKNFFYFKFIQIGFLIFDLVLLSYLVSLFLKNKNILYLIFLLSLIFIQNSWEHNVISAFPGFMTIPVALLLLSFICLFKSQKNDSKKLFFISVFLYFIVLFTYEVYIIYLPIFFLFFLSFEKKILPSIKKTLPYLIISLFYLLVYFLVRLIFGSHYLGVVPQKDLDIIAALKVIKQFSFSSIPGYLFIHPKYRYLLDIYNNSLYGFYGFWSIFKELQVQWLIRSILVFIGCFSILKNKKFYKKFSVFLLLIISLTYFLLPPLLLSITQQYQDSVIKFNQIGMPISYLSYLSFILLFLFSFLFFRSFLKNKIFDRIVLICFCVLCSLISLTTDYSNFYICKFQNLARYKWEIVDRFLKDKDITNLQYNVDLYAPNLSSVIGSVATGGSYWTDYLSTNLNKKILVKETLNADSFNPDEYVLLYRQKTKDLEQYLIFGKVSGISETGEVLVDNVCLYVFSKYDEYNIFGKVNSTKPVLVETNFGKQSKTDDYFIFNIDRYNYLLTNDLKKTCLVGKNIDVNSLVVEDKVNN